MSTKQTYLILLIVIVLAVVGFLLLPKMFNKSSGNPTPSVTSQTGIEVFLPADGETISSPVKVTGQINGNGWTAFEAQAGTVTVLDNSGMVIGNGILTAIGEWMQLPTKFETSLQFTATPGSSGFLVFKNENASGEPERDKTFFLPVKFK